jgi:phosphotransferase system enzyme I (PtsI)
VIPVYIFKGIPVAEGVAVSLASKYYPRASVEVPPECRAGEKDLEKLSGALERYKRYLSELLKIVDESERDLVQAYSLIAETLVGEARELVEDNSVCGELALKRVLDKYIDLMEESGSELFALRKNDLMDVALTLIEYMSGEAVQGEIVNARDKIVIAEELTPTAFLRLHRVGVKGIVTVKGGVTSHVAILARTYGIPYVIVPSPEVMNISDGSLIVVDGFEGKVIVDPSRELVEEYMIKVGFLRELGSVLREYAFRRAVTLDGQEVLILCNIGNVEDGRVASTQGCDGVGLFRVEYLYMSTRPPNEEILIRSFTKVAGFFENKPVVIRAPDLGADKLPPFLSIREDNPLLGLRGIRLLLEYRSSILEPFLRGFLKAYGASSNLKLMIPMVSRPSEVYEFIEVLESTASRLGLSYPSELELGIMIETPSSAVLIDKFAKIPHIKFVSFGTNDLTQYILAVDRTNPKLASLYNELEPSVLRVVAKSVEDALRYGVHVEVCGEIASKPLAIPILLALGIRTLSINPRYVGLIKYVINNLELKRFEHLRGKILDADDAKMVEDIVVNSLRNHNIDLRSVLLFSRTSS